jgi:tetratricopeptide (TPR) repeat protein
MCGWFPWQLKRGVMSGGVLLLAAVCCGAQQQAPVTVPTGDDAPAAHAPVTPDVMTAAAAADPIATLPPTEELADALAARGRYLLAIRTYEALMPTAVIDNKQGIACLHMMMYDKARASFMAAIKLNPKYAEAYNNLGTLAHSQNDWHTAEKMYGKSLKLKPDAANTLQNLGTLYYAEHKFKKGDAAYKQALAIDPHILENSSKHGIFAQSKSNSVSEIHYHLAMTYAQAGSKDLAIQYLRQAVAEGFHDRNRLLHDKEFADLRTTEVFLKIVDELKIN